MVVQSDDARTAAAAVFSVVRNASVPFGVSIPNAPNLSTTRWRTVADQKSRIYYVESALLPNAFWVDLAKVDFATDSGTRKLDLGVDMTNLQSGEVSATFTKAEPFAFEPVE